MAQLYAIVPRPFK